MMMINDVIVDGTCISLLTSRLFFPQCRNTATGYQITDDSNDESEYCADCGNCDGIVAIGFQCVQLLQMSTELDLSWEVIQHSRIQCQPPPVYR